MARYDFRTQRLYVEDALADGARLALDRERSHYLANVLRLKTGDAVLLFNGRDGEWRAAIAEVGRKVVALDVATRERPQPARRDLLYAFAPLKHARLDYMAQKAVEMGATRLAPVITQHTQAQRVNIERLRANAIEAAEQCGVLDLPHVDDEAKLARFLESLEDDRLLVFCDEGAAVANPVDALRAQHVDALRLAVLVGPEGGFSIDERALIIGRANVASINLGPRILRADTAAVAALAVVQCAFGDWN